MKFGTEAETQDMVNIMDGLLDSDNEDSQSCSTHQHQHSNETTQNTTNQNNNDSTNEPVNMISNTQASSYGDEGPVAKEDNLTEAAKDVVSINTEMIFRHNRFQKLLAKRANRVQKLNQIVNKTIQEVSGDDNTSTASKNNSATLQPSPEKTTSGTSTGSLSERFELKKIVARNQEKSKLNSLTPAKLSKEPAVLSLALDATQAVDSVGRNDTWVGRQSIAEATQKLGSFCEETQDVNEVTQQQNQRTIEEEDDYDDDEEGQVGNGPARGDLSALFVDEDDEEDYSNVKNNVNGAGSAVNDDDSNDKNLSVAERAMKKREQRLMRELHEEEALIKELESGIHNFQGSSKKSQKELLDIAMRTHELSSKYKLDPVIYSKIEIKKDDLLSEFGFHNGRFVPSRFQHAQSTQQGQQSSPVSSEPMSDKEVVIDADEDTEISDFGAGVEKAKAVKKENESTQSHHNNDPLLQYAAKLKDDTTSRGEIVLDSDTDGSSDSESEKDSVSKAKLFEIKLKFAKKNRHKYTAQQLQALQAHKTKNMSKQTLAQLMLQRHRAALIKQKKAMENGELNNDDDNGNGGEIEAIKKLVDGADEEGGEISVEKLLENELAYELNRAERLKQKSTGNDDDKDPEYEEEGGDYSEGGDEEEGDDDDDDEGDDVDLEEDDKEIDHSDAEDEKEVAGADDEFKSQTQIQYHKKIVFSTDDNSKGRQEAAAVDYGDDDGDANDDEEQEAPRVGKSRKARKPVLLDSDDEQEESASTNAKAGNNGDDDDDEVGFHLPDDSQDPFGLASGTAGTIASNDNDEADINLSLGGSGLTQKINNIFGKNGGSGPNLSQAFDASIAATDRDQPQSQDANVMQKLRNLDHLAMVDEEEVSASRGNGDKDVDSEELFDASLSLGEKGGSDNSVRKNKSFVAGFEFDATDGDQNTVSATEKFLPAELDGDAGFSQGGSFLVPATQEETQEDARAREKKKRRRRLQRRVDVGEEEEEEEKEENNADAELSDAESEATDGEEEERRRLEENRRMFALERKNELLKKRRELEMEKRGLKNVFDHEAEESDDEWRGVGGKDGDDIDVANSDDERMIDNATRTSKEDDEKLMEYINNQALAGDREMVEKLRQDIESGRLGKRRHGANYTELDDDDDDMFGEAIARFRQLRRAQQDQRVMANQSVLELSKKKKTRAFFQTIAEETNTYGFRESFGERCMPEADEGDGGHNASAENSGSCKRKVELSAEYVRKTLSFIDSDDDDDRGADKRRRLENSSDAEDDDLDALKRRSVFSRGLASRTGSSVAGDEPSRSSTLSRSSTATDEDSPALRRASKGGGGASLGASRGGSLIERHSLLRRKSLLTSAVIASYKQLQELTRRSVREGKLPAATPAVVVATGYKTVGGNSASITYLQSRSGAPRK